MQDKWKRFMFWPLNDTAINAIMRRTNGAQVVLPSKADKPSIPGMQRAYPSTADGREQGMPNFLQKITGSYVYEDNAAQKTSEVSQFMLGGK
jgi:hypothetical protein